MKESTIVETLIDDKNEFTLKTSSPTMSHDAPK